MVTRVLVALAMALALSACHPGEKRGFFPVGEDSLVGSWKGQCICADFHATGRFEGFPAPSRRGEWRRESFTLISVSEDDGSQETVQVVFEDDRSTATLVWEEGGTARGTKLARSSTPCGSDSGGDL